MGKNYEKTNVFGVRISRVVGIIWILSSIFWGILGVMGLLYVSTWMEDIQVNLEGDLAVIEETLESARIVIYETSGVVSSTHQSLGTIQKSVNDASDALVDIRPLLWKTTKVVTLDVPEALDGVQNSMPSLIETAKSVDETLNWLSNFKFTIPNPFGADWSYDLGISYNPQVPLDQAMASMSQNLVEIPNDLRNLEVNLSTADENLVIVSDDMGLLASDIELTNQRVGDIVPRLEDLVGNIEDIQTRFQKAKISVFGFFEFGRKLLNVIFVLLIFSQLPSLYMGVLLTRGNTITLSQY